VLWVLFGSCSSTSFSYLSEQLRQLPLSHRHTSNLRVPGQQRSEVPYCQHSTELGIRFLSVPCTYQTRGCWQAGCQVQSSVPQNAQSGIFQMCSALHLIQTSSPTVRNTNRVTATSYHKVLAVNMRSSAPRAALYIGYPKTEPKTQLLALQPWK